MIKALALAFLYFNAQVSVLSILRKKSVCADVTRYQRSALPCPQRGQADDLDYEILNAQKEISNLSGLKVIQAEGCIKQLYNLVPELKKEQEKHLVHNKLLAACVVPPLNYSYLKEKILQGFKAQQSGGGMPDYYSGEYCIYGNGGGALFLPLCVSRYINYTADREFLNQKVFYNRYSYKPLTKILPSSLCESVYLHTLRAIDSFMLNGNGLIDICSQGFAADGLTDNIICSLIYCYCIEQFLSNICDSKTKIKYVSRISNIKKAVLNICQSSFSTTFKMLKAISQGRQTCCPDFSDANLSNVPAAVIILYAEYFFNTGIDVTKLLSSLNYRNITLTESLLLKKAIIGCLAGINYRQGMLKAKPLCGEYKIIISNQNKSVVIEHKKNQKADATEIGGITFNNVDYINLSGYNKDIFITV
ncbi:MAG: hypothetical protein PHE12_04240 [Clostridia bacterium]|nr:hypothetical protein [Clostridia bacterium]